MRAARACGCSGAGLRRRLPRDTPPPAAFAARRRPIRSDARSGHVRQLVATPSLHPPPLRGRRDADHARRRPAAGGAAQPRIALAREKLHESQLTNAQGCDGWLPERLRRRRLLPPRGRHPGVRRPADPLPHRARSIPALQIKRARPPRGRLPADRPRAAHLAAEGRAEPGQQRGAAGGGHDLRRSADGPPRRGAGARAGEVRAETARPRRAGSPRRSAARPAPGRGDQGDAQQPPADRSPQLRQQGNAASAKLVYLLGLPPGTCLVPVGSVFAPVELVDVTPPACDLVAQALTSGPGVHELEGISARCIRGAGEDLRRRTTCCRSCRPTSARGRSARGRAASLAWDNRFDFGLQVPLEPDAAVPDRVRSAS